ncbi:MAG: GFA family protein [Gammaproteobacteria bacterium]|nr:GFA family protein [Gammaproteobacteria bacterium]
MSAFEVTGSCLCGQVKYRVKGPERVFQYCHCSRCQKTTGSAHASNIIVDPAQFEWLNGENHVGRFEHPEANHFAVSFCKRCGSNLPWLTKSGRSVVVPAGTLDDDPGIRPRHNIFLANQAPWYVTADTILQYDALPTKEN